MAKQLVSEWCLDAVLQLEDCADDRAALAIIAACERSAADQGVEIVASRDGRLVAASVSEYLEEVWGDMQFRARAG